MREGREEYGKCDMKSERLQNRRSKGKRREWLYLIDFRHVITEEMNELNKLSERVAIAVALPQSPGWIRWLLIDKNDDWMSWREERLEGSIWIRVVTN